MVPTRLLLSYGMATEISYRMVLLMAAAGNVIVPKIIEDFNLEDGLA